MVQPMPLAVSCFSKIRIGFIFLVVPHLVSPTLRVVERVSLLFCVFTLSLGVHCCISAARFESVCRGIRLVLVNLFDWWHGLGGHP